MTSLRPSILQIKYAVGLKNILGLLTNQHSAKLVIVFWASSQNQDVVVKLKCRNSGNMSQCLD